MSRTLVVFTHRTDSGRGALASEITQQDLDDGRGGVVGDYWVVEPGFRPQWTERAAFLEEWEPLKSPGDAADLGPAIDDARAQIDALAPAPAAAAPIDEPADDDMRPHIAFLLERLEVLEANHVAVEELGGAFARRIAALEDFDASGSIAAINIRLTALEQGLEKLEKALGVDPAELEQLDDDSGAAADDTGAPRVAKKRGGAK